jgi:hypothetical protein
MPFVNRTKNKNYFLHQRVDVYVPAISHARVLFKCTILSILRFSSILQIIKDLNLFVRTTCPRFIFLER